MKCQKNKQCPKKDENDLCFDDRPMCYKCDKYNLPSYKLDLEDMKDYKGIDLEKECIEQLQNELMFEKEIKAANDIKEDVEKKQKELFERIDAYIDIIEKAHKASAKSKLRFP